MTMKTNPAYTHFCFLSDSVCVRESLPLSSLYKGLISGSVEYVNPSGGPPCSFSLPTRPPLPHSPFPSRLKGIWDTSAEAWWARTSSPGWLCVGREEGEGEVHNIIPLTIPVPYGERTGLSSGTVSGVPLQSGTFPLKPSQALMWDHWCRKDEDCSLLSDYNLIICGWSIMNH